MAANKYVALVAGKLKEVFGTQTSTGAPDADKIVALNGVGKIDVSLLPAGVGPEIVTADTGVALAAGDFVNLYDVGGTLTARPAANTAIGTIAHGYVIAGSSPGVANASVYLLGNVNSAISSPLLVPGTRYFLGLNGKLTATAPTTAGLIVQELAIGGTVATEAITFGNMNTIEVA